MQLVGATKNFIRKPFLIKYLVLGFYGTFVALLSLSLIVYLINTKYPELDIQVDGGINLKTYQLCLEKGANIFVSGSTIFKHNNPKELISKLKGISSKT